MQDEILKHTEKIRSAVSNTHYSLKEKVREILIEIFIIVFAVSLSIWLHGWSEYRKQQAEVKEFLEDLKEDLLKDQKSMAEQKENIGRDLNGGSDILKKDSLTQPSFVFNFRLNTRKTNNGNYEGFKLSGRIAFIKNKGLKKQILRYYQEAMPSLEETEKNNYSAGLQVFETMAGSGHMNGDEQAKINVIKLIDGSLLHQYDAMLKESSEIIAEIDKELSDN